MTLSLTCNTINYWLSRYFSIWSVYTFRKITREITTSRLRQSFLDKHNHSLESDFVDIDSLLLLLSSEESNKPFFERPLSSDSDGTFSIKGFFQIISVLSVPTLSILQLQSKHHLSLFSLLYCL